jgi:hypothetical protein
MHPMFYVFDYVSLRLRISQRMRVSQRKAVPGTIQVLPEGPRAGASPYPTRVGILFV